MLELYDGWSSRTVFAARDESLSFLLASAIPIIGEYIVYWLWGGFSVGAATLNRFFSIHYLLPFIIAALSLIHLYLLHIYGSGNPIGVNSKIDCIPFYPYCYIKDLYSFIFFLVVFVLIVFFSPNMLGHSDNYLEANPMVTPTHIVPEWYEWKAYSWFVRIYLSSSIFSLYLVNWFLS